MDEEISAASRADSAFDALKSGQSVEEVAEIAGTRLKKANRAELVAFRERLAARVSQDDAVATSAPLIIDIQRLLIAIGTRLNWSDGLITEVHLRYEEAGR